MSEPRAPLLCDPPASAARSARVLHADRCASCGPVHPLRLASSIRAGARAANCNAGAATPTVSADAVLYSVSLVFIFAFCGCSCWVGRPELCKLSQRKASAEMPPAPAAPSSQCPDSTAGLCGLSFGRSPPRRSSAKGRATAPGVRLRRLAPTSSLRGAAPRDEPFTGRALRAGQPRTPS